jgi:hypothetical protein
MVLGEFLGKDYIEGTTDDFAPVQEFIDGVTEKLHIILDKLPQSDEYNRERVEYPIKILELQGEYIKSKGTLILPRDIDNKPYVCISAVHIDESNPDSIKWLAQQEQLEQDAAEKPAIPAPHPKLPEVA